MIFFKCERCTLCTYLKYSLVQDTGIGYLPILVLGVKENASYIHNFGTPENFLGSLSSGTSTNPTCT